MSKLCHLQLNVSSLEKSSSFYDPIMKMLGWKKEINEKNIIGYVNHEMSQAQWIFFEQTTAKFAEKKYHRKQTGLNHLAFYVDSKEEVDKAYDFIKQRATILYDGPKEYPDYGEGYYAIYFEDPDRVKLEVCYYPL